MQHDLPSSPFSPQRLLVPIAAVIASLGLASTSHAQTEIFGEWEGAGSVEYYVAPAPLGAPGNPGTRLAPLPSVTSALAAATAAGLLNAAPVTINLLGNGMFDQASGETFPIVLPAYGVSVEAHYLGGGNRPTVSAGGIGATEIFLINSVGNTDLPVSVIRGLTVVNSFNVPNSADIRIAVPPAEDPMTRVAPEIRDCVITGEPQFGVQIFSSPGIAMEPVLERNLITGIDPFFGTAGLDITGLDSDEGSTSVLARANQINRYQSNIRIIGGGMSNQCRIQSNFVSVGETNVELDNCAPFLVNNTIAFAFSNTQPTATGIAWGNMPALGLSNNLFWNPDQGGVTAIDIAGNLNVFAGATTLERLAFYNVDEDNTLYIASVNGVVNVITGMDILSAPGPIFVGGDLGMGSTVTDLHLAPASAVISQGYFVDLVTPYGGGVSSAAIPTAFGTVNVRRDTIYDIDFGARLAGNEVEIGADEFTDLGTGSIVEGRGATLVPVIGTTFGVDMDELGNMVPDANGLWNTQIDIVGTPGDFAWLFACHGFSDTATSASGAVVENRFLMQNTLVLQNLIPGVLTIANLGLELGAFLQTFNGGVIPPSGVLRTNLTFGAPQAALIEGEVQLQGLVLSPNGQATQATNRLTVEVNL